MTREEKAYAWLDRQVDRFRSKDNKIKLLKRHSDEILDRQEGIRYGIKMGMGADGLNKVIRKTKRNNTRMNELSKSLEGKRLISTDPTILPRMSKIGKNREQSSKNTTEINKLIEAKFYK